MMETFRNHPKYVRRTRRRSRKLVGKAKTPQLRIQIKRWLDEKN
jgi:hypothetical protein